MSDKKQEWGCFLAYLIAAPFLLILSLFAIPISSLVGALFGTEAGGAVARKFPELWLWLLLGSCIAATAAFFYFAFYR